MIKSYDKIEDIEFSTEDFQIYSPEFLKVFEEANTLTPESGWHPLYFADKENFLYSYIKTNSYGEFIFDWAWADLYQRARVPYYPKLIHALPFTPVNATKFIGNKEELFQSADDVYRNSNVNSHHFLFTNKEETQFLEKKGFFTQVTIQYHWKNRWENFDHFLDTLKKRKRKQIKKERRFIEESNIEIIDKRADVLEDEEIFEIYELYLSTIHKKFSQAYLNLQFFKLLKNAQYKLAYLGDELIAMALFLKTEKTLYGRYWGIKPEYEEDYRYLHFELCYYQGMEMCFENSLELFEAGAQGEQKLLRGFTPVEILSSHRLKHPELEKIICDHTKQQNKLVAQKIDDLQQYLPFKA